MKPSEAVAIIEPANEVQVAAYQAENTDLLPLVLVGAAFFYLLFEYLQLLRAKD